MKREVSRRKKLPAFALDIGELEALWTRLAALFEDPDRVYATFSIILPSENLEFNNIDELKRYSELEGKITRFSLWLSQGNRTVSLASSSLFLNSRPEVSASGETEAWCAGAIETAYSFLLTNKLWYSWFVAAPFGWLLLLCVYVGPISLFLSHEEKRLDVPVFVAWLGIMIAITMLYFLKAKLLPLSVLIITQKDNFLRSHAGELSLIVAIISLVFTVIEWFA